MTFVTPSFIWYMFASLNSWSRLSVFNLMGQVPPQAMPFPRLQIERPHSFYPQNNNSLEEMTFSLHTVFFSVCQGSSLPVDYFEWTLFDRKDNLIEQFKSQSCAVKWRAPSEGAFTLHVKSVHHDVVLHESKETFKVIDYWIAAIGDSFASGEGNPDMTVRESRLNSAYWISEECHRSKRSFPFKIFNKLRDLSKGNVALHFTFLACVGASVDSGPASLLKQSSELAKITQLRNRGPELLLLTAGGNDVGYSMILQSLLRGQNPLPNNGLRLFYVSHELDKLATFIKEKIRPSQVIVPTYFSLALNEKEEFDVSCSDLRNVSEDDIKKAHRQILERLNQLIVKKGREFNWTVVPKVTSLFKMGGVCSKRSLIRNISDSIRLQGDSGGSFHPTEEAHDLIANLIFTKIQFKQLLIKPKW